MRRGLVHVLAWLLATGAAVTLSWWGVHTVMAGTAYDPPRALPITAVEETAQASQSLASSTSRPAPSDSPSPSPEPTETARTSREPSTEPPGTPASTAPKSPASSPTSAGASSGQVKSYDTKGGRAVFDLGPASASLVSATPGAGWSMQVWKTESWIRVEFTSGADRVSVFCTWHDGPPRVEIGTY
ncbi:hypothetical protein J7I94_15830 [Streptomyces sp. ISL-12]|uniref:hypothetical protein n=1 Tax=Streptomyces sp. ISL-12 TaxID=2819177 RepID=UPI001BE95257|nr:hypothetical protein [Streptomyces sp. ISL-12]MBT2412021.1 hypothetical protein [Streptomyces sp. ISL-12]